MLIGYARVSTTDQNLTLQKDALEKAGCERIYEDELSGTKDNRPGLLKAIEMLRENDTLVVWKLGQNCTLGLNTTKKFKNSLIYV